MAPKQIKRREGDASSAAVIHLIDSSSSSDLEVVESNGNSSKPTASQQQHQMFSEFRFAIVAGGRGLGTRQAQVLEDVVVRHGGLLVLASPAISTDGHAAHALFQLIVNSSTAQSKRVRQLIVVSGFTSMSDLARFILTCPIGNSTGSSDELAQQMARLAEQRRARFVTASAISAAAEQKAVSSTLWKDHQLYPPITSMENQAAERRALPERTGGIALPEAKVPSPAVGGFTPVFFPSLDNPAVSGSAQESLAGASAPFLPAALGPSSSSSSASLQVTAAATGAPHCEADSDGLATRAPYPWELPPRSDDETSANPLRDTPLMRNAYLIAELEKLQKVYVGIGDHWRSYAYGRAIGIIRRVQHEITSAEELRDKYGIGDRILTKIEEVLRTGGTWKLKYMRERDDVACCEALSKIWGVGPKASQRLYRLGLRDVATLRENVDGITFRALNHNQLLGLRYHDDLIRRIPREEVAAIEAIVFDAMRKVTPLFEPSASAISGKVAGITCGSYRRGLPHSGDVDILFGEGYADRSVGLMRKLLAQLRSVGSRSSSFVLETLSQSSRAAIDVEAPDTWFGIVQIPDCVDESKCPCEHRTPEELERQRLPPSECRPVPAPPAPTRTPFLLTKAEAPVPVKREGSSSPTPSCGSADEEYRPPENALRNEGSTSRSISPSRALLAQARGVIAGGDEDDDQEADVKEEMKVDVKLDEAKLNEPMQQVVKGVLAKPSDVKWEYERSSDGLHYCRGKHVARRVDIKIYPSSIFPFAILYFTGDGFFNRSMRLHAMKIGMHLSDRALTRVIKVKGQEVHKGAPIPCSSEEQIFEALSMPFVPPVQRSL